MCMQIAFHQFLFKTALEKYSSRFKKRDGCRRNLCNIVNGAQATMFVTSNSDMDQKIKQIDPILDPRVAQWCIG